MNRRDAATPRFYPRIARITLIAKNAFCENPRHLRIQFFLRVAALLR
jgi:hypothetical protein